ncbi:MAG: hypothetical protein ACYTGG_08015, partial [Planctomycetota bacterium]
MRTNRPNPTGNDRRARSRARRGNSLVLVAGVLVLLVIVATAYLSRTGAGRITAVAQQDTQVRDDVGLIIADLIAREISEALFPREVRRLPIRADAMRYGRDNTFVPGVGRAAGYNFAPYEVVPFTNWPDPASLGLTSPLDTGLWPAGTGNPGGGSLSVFLSADYNPRGNPGYGDARWLADLEPMRWDSDGDGVPDRFSHWRHMSNLSRPDNGWRIVRDIADVFDQFNSGYGGLMGNLDVPIEQWLPIVPAAVRLAPSDDASIPLTGTFPFLDVWNGWMWGDLSASASPPNGLPYARLFADSQGANIPPNF